jgi:AraC-like DNA-binding protein
MSQEMFITRKPNNSLLDKHIAYYYFHSSLDNQLQKEFIFYPGYKNALTIYNHSKVIFGVNYSSVKPDTESDYIFIYSGMQKYPRIAQMTSPYDKIGIIFKELGINHFIKEPLSIISPHPIDKSFNYFGNDLVNTCNAIYKEEDIDVKVNLLNLFFESKFCDFPEQVVKHCVDFIIHSLEKPTVESLTTRFHTPKKTLLRLFQKHLDCSVKDFIDIVQFRKSLDSYLLQNRRPLTDVALENGYYDQPQFINHFKKLALTNPKKFFNDIEKVNNTDIFWTFRK